MGLFDRIRGRMKSMMFGRWKEVGDYQSSFSSFGYDAYRSELVRSCIRPLADFTGKASVKCSNKQVEALLSGRPNMYMSSKAFLSKVRTLYELHNNCFIYIDKEVVGKTVYIKSFYPISYASFEALEYNNGLFIRFKFINGEDLILPWEDLAVVRKDYNKSNIAGDDNDAIINTLNLIQTTNQGLSNAIRATANLRGILKTTKAILAPEDVKAAKDNFVRDYLSLENAGGIASLDATQEFTPINMSPVVTSWEQSRELRENVYRYFGVNDDIVMGRMSAEQLETFYELRIEPFLVDLSTELTTKVFSQRELSFGNYIIYEANKLQFASLDKKIEIWSQVVLYGGMTINEWRAACNMAPIEGGDELIRRLDAAPVDQNS